MEHAARLPALRTARRPLAAVLTALTLAACQTLPPAITGITIFPADRHGEPQGDDLRRTALGPPIPVIGVRPGDDPRRSSLFLNEPRSGRIAITLARGVQNFLLYTPPLEAGDHFVITVFLEHEPTPALSAVVSRDPAAPLVASSAPSAIGLDGAPVANRSRLSVDRRGYDVTLRRAVFPLADTRVDTVNPWLLHPDNVYDAVGLITIEVRTAGGAPRV